MNNFRLAKNILYTTQKSAVLLRQIYSKSIPSLQCVSYSIQTQNNPDVTSKISRVLPKNAVFDSEKQFLVRLRNDPDVFGTPTIDVTDELIDEGDIEEEQQISEQPSNAQRLRLKQYAEIIKDYLQKHQIKEAIDVLELRMLKTDRVKPNNYIYNLLLGGCGRVGYTKKAFRLYNDMKKRGLLATGGTYTALFNACANSPWPADGLSRANHLRNIMLEKQYEPNVSNYHAMIKAYGRCGDIATAFALVDEMAEKRVSFNSATTNFLLQACISDKSAGFRHALLVWHKMMVKRVPPDLYTFNLLLRCVRDCGLGDVEVMQDVLQQLLGKRSDVSKFFQPTLALEAGSTNDPTENSLEPLQLSTNTRPNLLAKTPHLGSIISLNEVTKPEHRLLLLGGCSSFLDTMIEYNCNPDIKTFTQLLDMIPGSISAEQDLLNYMKKTKVKPDIDFFNMLIKKRSLRFDYKSAKEVLGLMGKYNYRPDVITYGVLSLGCETKEEALDLLNEMAEAKYRLNAEIVGAMLHQACYHSNFSYVMEMMDICVRERVEVNKKFTERLAEFYKHTKRLSNAKDCSKQFEKSFLVFKSKYREWLKEVTIDEGENAHPWQQYRQNRPGDVKYKPKDTARFPQQHISRFKVKTSPKYLDQTGNKATIKKIGSK